MNGARQIQLFISQPMRGFTDEEITLTRKRVAGDAIKKAAEYFQTSVCDVDIIDSVIKDFDANVHPLIYLGDSIKMISEADIVYFARGWQDARGCAIEHECAKQYGKACIYY